MDAQAERLTDAELHTLFDRLFPEGFAGADVRAEVAPNGWEQSPLVACFHPSVARVFEERLQFHQNVAALRIAGSRRTGQAQVETEALPVPTLEDVRREYEPEPVQADAELTALVGLCLWDVFSDNHDVITADGRVADIGSFTGRQRWSLPSVLRTRSQGLATRLVGRFTVVARERPDALAIFA